MASERTFKPGDRVLWKPRKITGKVVAVHERTVEIEVPDIVWSRFTGYRNSTRRARVKLASVEMIPAATPTGGQTEADPDGFAAGFDAGYTAAKHELVGVVSRWATPGTTPAGDAE